MNNKPSFFSMANAKQPVNSWLCIAFISLLCFWVVLYYFTAKAEEIGENFSIIPTQYIN